MSRYNSTIKNIKGICCDCAEGGVNDEKYIIAGRCSFHYKIYRAWIKQQEQEARSPKVISIKTKVVKVDYSKLLTAWYEERRYEMTGLCCNCPNHSLAGSSLMWKWSIAHILPKEHFKSVMTHPLNWIELCERCHTLFDRNYMTASKMQCFPFAVQRFSVFEPLITEKHKLLTIFKSYADVI